MKSLTIQQSNMHQESEKVMPVTSRGRALHTIDRFLNGKPTSQNHDNTQLTLERGCGC